MNGHDWSESPDHEVAKLDATMEAILTRCGHCEVVVEVIPAGGTRFVIGTTHEPTCPEFVDV